MAQIGIAGAVWSPEFVDGSTANELPRDKPWRIKHGRFRDLNCTFIIICVICEICGLKTDNILNFRHFSALLSADS